MKLNIIYGVVGITDAARMAIRNELKKAGCEVLDDNTVRGIKTGIDQAVSSYRSSEQLVLILSHRLEPKNPFTFRDLLRYRKDVPNVKIILVVGEELKGSPLLKDMSDNEMYLALYGNDTDEFIIKNLIVVGRTVEQAKNYYGVNDLKNITKQLTIDGAVRHMTQPVNSDKEYMERIRWVRGTLASEDAFFACVQRLPDNIKDMLAQDKAYYPYVEDYVIAKTKTGIRANGRNGVFGKLKGKAKGVPQEPVPVKSNEPEILEQKLTAEELEQKYWIDVVTGLYNRNAYEKKVCNEEVGTLTLVSIDANDLKKTNDSLGHEAGDELLKKIAKSIVEVWGKEKAFRTGGDEFIVICSGTGKKAAEKSVTAFKRKLAEQNVSAAVGVASASDVEGTVTVEQILKLSDKAMYADKNAFKRARAEQEEKEKAVVVQSKDSTDAQEGEGKASGGEGFLSPGYVMDAVKSAIRRTVIGVAGGQKHIGCTHQTLLIAHMLAEMGFKVAAVEDCNQSDKVFDLIADEHGKVSGDMFSVKGVDYYPCFSLKQLPTLNVKNYNFVVVDFGLYNAEMIEEYGRCSLQILVTGTRVWETSQLGTVFESVEESQLMTYHYLFLGTPEAKKEPIKRDMKPLKNIFFGEYAPNPYDVKGYQAIRDILSDFIVTGDTVKKKTGLLGIWRKH